MNWKIIRWIDIYAGILLVYLFFSLKRLFGSRRKFRTIRDYKRILFIKFWGLGNVIMLLPAVYALKDKYPDAEFDFLTLVSNKDVAKAAPLFDNIYTIDNKSTGKFIFTFFKAFRILKGRDYDFIIDFEQFARFSAIFCSLIRKRNIIAFNTRRQHRHFLYTNSVIYNNNIHMAKSFYSLAEIAGAAHKDCIKPVPVVCKQGDIFEIENMLSNWGVSRADILIVMHAGTSENFGLRRWPAEYFGDLADRLIDDFGVKIIFTGLLDESIVSEKAIDCMKNKEKAINASGKLNFNEFVSLIKLSDLVISADTAPIHLASCLSVPVVGLYGPNTPLLYGPWGYNSIWFYKNFDCSPCITNYNAKINNCRHPRGKGACMKEISVDEVFSGIKNNYFDKDAKFRLKKLRQFKD
ncbi:MAG: glycosyltransferase family 9 protein [Candidatus Omnitrophota bacterium]